MCVFVEKTGRRAEMSASETSTKYYIEFKVLLWLFGGFSSFFLGFSTTLCLNNDPNLALRCT